MLALLLMKSELTDRCIGMQIRVFCRIKPHPRAAVNVAPDHQTVKLYAEGKDQSFTFDRVFGPQADQAAVFQEVSELVQSALDGYKARTWNGWHLIECGLYCLENTQGYIFICHSARRCTSLCSGGVRACAEVAAGLLDRLCMPHLLSWDFHQSDLNSCVQCFLLL